MKCNICNKEVEESFTSNKNKQICKECLEKEIYKERKKVINNEKGRTKKRIGISK